MEKMNSNRILVGKPEGKRPLGRLKRRRVDNIKMDLKRERMGSGERPAEGPCEHDNEPSGSIKCWEFLE
jgi:hypothetical protein